MLAAPFPLLAEGIPAVSGDRCLVRGAAADEAQEGPHSMLDVAGFPFVGPGGFAVECERHEHAAVGPLDELDLEPSGYPASARKHP